MSTAPTPVKDNHSCNCGCAKCRGECCELECLVQPRFFCGQLLSDQDLTTLLDWVKAKTALARYRDGWGIVCGLDVRCGMSHSCESAVVVTPGYALDCCGNDVVVCSETTFDFAACCGTDENPCANPSAPTLRKPTPNDATMTVGGWQLPKSEVHAADLMIRYSETQSDSRTALVRGSCGGTTPCEYARTHESFELYCKPVEGCDDPSEKSGIEWYQGYVNGRNELLDELVKIEKIGDARQVLESLIRWLIKHPPNGFCFLRDRLCAMQQENQVPEVNTWFPEAVFWIVQDWRSQYLRCSCAGCGPDLGIRLARVWMWRHADRQGRQKCQVLYIDAYSPFRRRIANECWPTRPESIGLQQFIWEVADSACAPLRRLGLGAISLERLQFRSTGQFAEQLKSEVMFVSCWDRSQTDSLIGYYYPDICGHTRIVHFAARAADQKPAREISTLPADHPDLDLRTVNGIGDGIAKRLKAKGYANIVALAAASPEEIHKALASMPINPPDEERSARYVKDAQARLEQLQKGE